MNANWDITQAPIDEEMVGTAGLIVRWLAGAAFVGYSLITTIIIIGNVFNPIFASTLYGVGYGNICGFVLAVAVTIAEWATSKKVPRWHWLIVVTLDAPFTTWQTAQWVNWLTTFHIGVLSLQIVIAIWVFSLVFGIATAKFGEMLLVKR